MKASLLLSFLFLATLNFSCKKSKSGDDPGVTRITTLELQYAVPSFSFSGLTYTFRVRFEELGEIEEFGILYVPWIADKTQKTPTWGDPETRSAPFPISPSAAGTIETSSVTLLYSDFNNANYRAYAIKSDGSVVYGEVMYFSIA